MGKTEHIINLSFVGDSSVKNIITNRASAGVQASGVGSLGAKSLNKLGSVVNNLSNLSHDSLVEVNLIEHGVELLGHTSWGSEHTKDSIEVLVLNGIVI